MFGNDLEGAYDEVQIIIFHSKTVNFKTIVLKDPHKAVRLLISTNAV